ncbi:MAG: polyphosphate kinase, partial [Rhodospirillales bacterium]|nr:polyphosphate kinase [Rhodospirillales bacterium]
MSARVFEEVERERVRELSKAAFEEQATALRVSLVESQRALAKADFPVIVLFAGVDGGGKGETVNLLTEWLDPRRIVTHAYDRLTEEEGQRPEFWRYWRDLPARGRLGLFLSSWYSAPLLDRAYGRIGPSALDRKLARIAAFERTLADDGALILKFWMHLDKKAQQQRLEALQKHPRDHWRISQWDWRNWHRYDHFNEAAEHIITRTSTAETPWLMVDGRHARYRSLRVLGMVNRALEARLAGLPPPDAGFRARAPVASPAVVGATVREVKPLATIDQTKTVGRKAYEKSMARLRADLYWLAAQNLLHGLSVVLVFEGWDAGGKGGAIRRMVSALDARSYRVHQVSAPSDEERAHHYLWRFWRRLPEAGQIAVFDRSWYGRLLVERVESFATEAEWRRAYAEIRDFEEQIIGHGTLLMKFWLHIDKDEQERRFL